MAHHRITAGQILLTLADTEERRRYLNARATTVKLLEMRAVPVINENDTVATSEIRYGDNDRLAARVATMIGADLLVLFSDVDGLYTAPPAGDPTARHIAAVERITPAIEAMAGGAGSDLSRGGMRTKIEAGKIATVSGIHMVIADGRRERPLQAIADGARCTWFLTPSNPVTARKGWIAGALEPRGTLVVDAGAARALAGGASLLPVGVRRIEGAFARGDAVVVSDRRPRARARARRLRRRRGREDHRPREPRDRGYPRLPRPRRDDPPRRSRPDAAARGKGRAEAIQGRPRASSSRCASCGAALLTSLSKKHHTSRPWLRQRRMSPAQARSVSSV